MRKEAKKAAGKNHKKALIKNQTRQLSLPGQKLGLSSSRRVSANGERDGTNSNNVSPRDSS